ncbi:MAG: hypothetical protein K9K62_02740 [Desulfobacteraceae bacterium]|nr:hypothetical protein [Desulfobacteraceae bacterium]
MKPLKTKIFTYFTLNINPPNELQINQWLAANPGIEIVDMLQSESMTTRNGEVERNLSITIVYRETKQAQS